MRTLLSIETVAGTFVKDVELISGQDLLACNQCGKCGAGCPVAGTLDLLPNAVIRLAQLGQEDVLESQTIWVCAACQTCISLPLSASHTEEEVDRVIAAVTEVGETHHR